MPLPLLALRAIVCGVPQVHCQGVIVHFQTMALLLKLCHHLLQLLRLSFSTGEVLNSVVLYGNSALEDAVVVLQLCQLTLQAAGVQGILEEFTTILSHTVGLGCTIKPLRPFQQQSEARCEQRVIFCAQHECVVACTCLWS